MRRFVPPQGGICPRQRRSLANFGAGFKAAVYNPARQPHTGDMEFDGKTFLTALGLAFILEGLPYFLLAERMPTVLRFLSERPAPELRRLGLTAILAGLAVVALVRW